MVRKPKISEKKKQRKQRKNKENSGDCQPQYLVVMVNRFFLTNGFISSLNY
jgi:hypothetical protein